MATILIVEDHTLSREVLGTLLEHTGHRILEATDGISALALARSERPDLIISDILIPEIDGMEFVRYLRAETTLEKTPVIFYTATCRLPEELQLDETYGACRVIPKPSDPCFILQTVNEVLKNLPADVAPLPAPLPVPAGTPFAQSAGLQLAVLMDLSYNMVAQRDPEQLLNTVSRAVREILHCRCSLLAINEDKGKTRYFLGRAESDPACSCPADLLPPAEIIERVVSEHTPVRWIREHGSSAEQAFDSLLAVPFASPTRVYGWISLMDRLDAAPFTDGDEEMAVTISTQAALAYENILLFEQLCKSEEYLEELVKERTAELERAHEELLKAQKLESLGVLAGGIAHDFNNALTAIVNHIHLAMMKSDPMDKAYRNLHLAEKACFHAQSLTRQLLTFAKGGSPVKKAAELPGLLRDTVEFALRGSQIKCEFSIAPDLFVVEIDQGQISQVLSNLVINAEQAMPAGGTVKVSAENVVLRAGDALPLKAGRYVKISINDQGAGIPREELHRIFDPYFTTKKTGSGLGLTAAYSIIKKHDGYITVESSIGAGTTFHVYLPACAKKLAGVKEDHKLDASGGRVLLIEDQEFLANSIAELLGFYGYKVDAAGDGASGLALYENAMRSGRPYHAVIMDLTIPGGMGGKESIKRLRELDSSVPAIVASGYSNDPVMSNYRDYGFNGAISKPYQIEDMVRELQRIISM